MCEVGNLLFDGAENCSEVSEGAVEVDAEAVTVGDLIREVAFEIDFGVRAAAFPESGNADLSVGGQFLMSTTLSRVSCRAQSVS